MSKTPRTDYAASLVQYAVVGEQYEVVTAEFARQLERELSAAEAKVDALTQQQEALLTLGDQLADWINLAGPALKDLLDAYERRIRSLCTPEELGRRPWECFEFIKASRVLDAKPVAVVDLALPIVNGGASTTASGTQDQTAWLIEMPDARWGTGYFWCGPDGFKHSSGDWGVIERAIRFSRKEDAENVIRGINARNSRFNSLMRLEACEHMWVDVPHEQVDGTAPETSTRSADE